MLPPPENPIAAVTHPAPYAYYAELVSQRPLDYDDALKLWVASSTEIVTEVLTHPACRVRPVSEPVPNAIAGSASGNVFQHLMRMNDGPKHDSVKHRLAPLFPQHFERRVRATGQRWAAFLFERCLASDSDLTAFTFQLPVYVMAALLGLPDDVIPQSAESVGAFVRGLAPLASSEQRQQGSEAADTLRALILSHAESLPLQGATQGDSADLFIANLIGLLMQSYDATAGLIGNTLRTLALHPAIHAQVMSNIPLLSDVIHEVLRWDAPIQNTRRFLAEDAVIGGHTMTAGDTILVVLAAANRDPALNPDPTRFDIHRTNRRLCTFGIGSHACPADRLAPMIAQAAVEQILRSGVLLTQWAGEMAYHSSVNARIPILNRPVMHPIVNSSHFHF